MLATDPTFCTNAVKMGTCINDHHGLRPQGEEVHPADGGGVFLGRCGLLIASLWADHVVMHREGREVVVVVGGGKQPVFRIFCSNQNHWDSSSGVWYELSLYCSSLTVHNKVFAWSHKMEPLRQRILYNLELFACVFLYWTEEFYNRKNHTMFSIVSQPAWPRCFGPDVILVYILT